MHQVFILLYEAPRFDLFQVFNRLLATVWGEGVHVLDPIFRLFGSSEHSAHLLVDFYSVLGPQTD